MDDHTTSDDASRYRTEEMLAPWRAKDPIDRLRKYLTAKKGWDDKKETDLVSELTAKVEEAVKAFEASPLPNPTDIFNHMYAETPWHLSEQRKEVLQLVGGDSR